MSVGMTLFMLLTNFKSEYIQLYGYDNDLVSRKFILKF